MAGDGCGERGSDGFPHEGVVGRAPGEDLATVRVVTPVVPADARPTALGPRED